MFVQVIQGKVSDERQLRRCMDRWAEELQPGATGYLGSTSGIREDGMFILLVRFESHEAAVRNSERPEQGAWWAETEQCFDGPVSFMDCPDPMEWLGGGSDDAGFVQIMEGHTTDSDRLRELLTQSSDRLHSVRPEIIGGMFASNGEKLTDFDLFHPDRMASRILDMGHVLTLIEQAETTFDAEQAMKAAEKLSGRGG